ncbi:hypothetical protein PA10_00036 [Pseudomonas phage pPa_SNUABM_DT01]|nr:hypothetical protein PA10_00036 [Pseudomonas phage pPa_SNUABM_DT01]
MNDQVRRFPQFAGQRSIPNEVKAAISKLGADPHGSANKRGNMRLPDGRVMAHVANTTIGNIRDARNLFQILPDMDYARQILISATISPGDLTDTKVLYSLADDSLDSNLSGPLLRMVQEFFDNSYRIRPLLHPILNDVMFETGSYPIMMMPESSIDRIINSENYGGVSMESAQQTLDAYMQEETKDGKYIPWGILGNANAAKDNVDSYTGVSFESLTFNGSSYNSAVQTTELKVSFENLLVDNEANKKYRSDLQVQSTEMNKILNSKGSTVDVIDNLTILKRPQIVETRRKLAVRRIYGGKLHQRASLESRAQNGDRDAARNLAAVERSMYQKRRYQHIPVQPIMTHSQTGTETYGHPLVMHLPSESVIPIHVPGNPAEHVGYYVMLDIDGNPISVADQTSYYDDIKSQMNNVDSYASQIIQQARRGFEGMGDFHNEIIDEMGKVYSEAIERDLLARLRAGALSGNYELGKTENINRIMFGRHMKGQKTIMLYVPAELMTYIAFDYNEFGVGKSVLEDGKILGAIRASLMLSNTLATLNNAVGGKTIEIELDPEDEDPVSTVEFMLSEYAKVNAQGFSRIIGSTHPLGLADQIQNHGVNVVVSGNTRYPETKLNVSSRDGTNKPIDSDFEETMRKRHIQMFGLSPEVMEGINQADFATTVVQNNLMLLKRVIMNQEKFEPFLTDFVRRYILNSGTFLEDMRALIIENKTLIPDHIKQDERFKDDEAAQVDAFLFEFIDSLMVGLPSPEVGDIRKAMESFDSYSEALDKVIDAYVNEEMFAADYSVGMEQLIPNIKAVTKAEFQRRWLRKHNVMPELDVFNTVREEDQGPAFDLLGAAEEHLDGLNGSIASYVKRLVKAAKKRAKVLEKLTEEKTELENLKNDAAGAGGDDYGSDAGGGDGGDDLGDGGDAGLDLDGGDAGDGGTDEGGDGLDMDLDGGDGTDTGDAGDGTDGLDLDGGDGADGTDGGESGADAELAALDAGGEGGDAEPAAAEAASADADLALDDTAADATGDEAPAEPAEADADLDLDEGDGTGTDTDADNAGAGDDLDLDAGTEQPAENEGAESELEVEDEPEAAPEPKEDTPAEQPAESNVEPVTEENLQIKDIPIEEEEEPELEGAAATDEPAAPAEGTDGEQPAAEEPEPELEETPEAPQVDDEANKPEGEEEEEESKDKSDKDDLDLDLPTPPKA